MQLIYNATNAGVVIAVAAGNSSANTANYIPAKYGEAVITVSSAREGDNWNGFFTRCWSNSFIWLKSTRHELECFENVSVALLNQATSTSSWNNTSGNPHSEDMLDASGL